MSFGKKLAERTGSIRADSSPKATNTLGEAPRTSPGRLLAATTRISAAEERVTVAETNLAEALERVAELEALVGRNEGDEVAIDDFVEVPGRRRVLSRVERLELASNLASNALATPVVYRLLADGRKEIVSGHNRIDIYKNDLGRTKIRAVPFTGTQEQAELAATFANLLAPSLPDFEKYRQFVRLQEVSGFTRADIIQASGLSDSHVSRIFAFERLPAAAIKAIALRPDRLGGNAAEEFAVLAKAGDQDLVIKAIQALTADDSLTQKHALAMARPPGQKRPAAAQRSISIGRKKLCDVSVRNGVVGFRFAGKEGDAAAQQWAAKIEEFIRRELERDSEH
ncbi:ParB/RepB/Spo0J family partition protein [Burkholderia alba]|uniref:ParB/RepB/Spo0J family partition protein n=1 Tax=Burkholderia alba TaxID=2683677 RepID=UPI002B0557D9|nr:chromosome partitioning protein ParB [Burkholderia alba]